MTDLFYPFLTCNEYFAFPIYPSLDQPHFKHRLASGHYMEKSRAPEDQVSLQLTVPSGKWAYLKVIRCLKASKHQGCKNRCRIRDFISQGMFTQTHSSLSQQSQALCKVPVGLTGAWSTLGLSPAAALQKCSALSLRNGAV